MISSLPYPKDVHTRPGHTLEVTLAVAIEDVRSLTRATTICSDADGLVVGYNIDVIAAAPLALLALVSLHLNR